LGIFKERIMKKAKILAIQNCEIEGFGEYEKYIIDQGLEYEVIHPYRDSIFPAPENYDAVLLGGTPLSANDIDEHPFLQAESTFLEEAIRLNKRCLGICFGAEILAIILGATVTLCRPKEIGGYRIRLTDAGKDDPLLEGFPDDFPVFQWHGDQFEIPSKGLLLAEGDFCLNQLFRLGNVVGVQFHLETTCREAGLWADAYAEELEEVGKSKNQVIEECRAGESERLALARRFMENFLGDLI